LKTFPHDAGILQVVLDHRFHLFGPLFRIDGGSRLLNRVGDAIEFGCMPAHPQWLYRMWLTIAVISHQFIRDDCEGTTRTGEPCSLGKASEFDGHAFRSFDLIDGMRNGRIGYKRLVGCIIKNNALILDGIVYPFLKYLFGCNRPGWIVGETKEDEIGSLSRQFRKKSVFFGTRHVDDPVEIAIGLATTCFARHHGSIGVNRINRITDSDNIFIAKYLLDIACITFGAVRYKYFIR